MQQVLLYSCTDEHPENKLKHKIFMPHIDPKKLRREKPTKNACIKTTKKLKN